MELLELVALAITGVSGSEVKQSVQTDNNNIHLDYEITK